MHAEIISIGSELTTGAKLDTNSQWLSRELANIGITVRYHTTVADDLGANIAVFRTAAERADLVLITGGLGPTLDDLTRDAVAGMLDAPLLLHEPSLEFIRELFSRRNREMPERNIVQAMFPEGTEPIFNRRGTAPGIWAEMARDNDRPACHLAAMPGVPSEMREMFHREVLPKLKSGTERSRFIRLARVNCFGPGESQAEEWLGDLTARGRDPEIGITVSKATITLRITSHGESSEACDRKIHDSKKLIYERMGKSVFGEEDEQLQDVVVRMLTDRGQTLATAESGTGGLLAHLLTEVEGFESAYLGGVVAPTDAAKTDLLEVAPQALETSGAISAEVAAAMAVGCRERFHTAYALAVTECPKDDPDNSTTGVPTAFIALAGEHESTFRELNMGGDPAIVKARVAKTALNLLRHALAEAETDMPKK